MKMSVAFSTGKTFSSPSEGVPAYPYTAVLKHRFQVDGKSILEWAGHPLWPEQPSFDVGVPSVVRAITDSAGFCYFPREWQLFSLELIKMRIREVKAYSEAMVISEAKAIFRVIYRDKAFQTNKFGTTTCADHVNGTNLDAEDMKLFPVSTGSNPKRVLGDKKLIAGEYYYPTECLNASARPPDPISFNWHTHPELIHQTPYIETRIKTPSGGREIRPFSFRGVEKIPYFILRKDSNIAWIKSDRID